VIVLRVCLLCPVAIDRFVLIGIVGVPRIRLTFVHAARIRASGHGRRRRGELLYGEKSHYASDRARSFLRRMT
jgi:hypothetical protein